MSLFQTFVLGIVQGLTEFIPVSSSAHLVLVPWLLGWTFEQRTEFVFHILVQLGTLVAVVIYFWGDLVALGRAAVLGIVRGSPFETVEARQAWLLALATVPAGVVGLAFKDYFENSFGDPVRVAIELLGTSAIIWVSELVGRRVRRLESIGWLDALAMGLGQAVAIFPGISRSASTIAFGLGRNLERPAAARFAFLMSVPVFLGAGVVAVKDLLEMPNFAQEIPPTLVGFAAAAVVGYLCIRWLLGFLARHPMKVFAYYCTVASLACLLIALFRG